MRSQAAVFITSAESVCVCVCRKWQCALTLNVQSAQLFRTAVISGTIVTDRLWRRSCGWVALNADDDSEIVLMFITSKVIYY